MFLTIIISLYASLRFAIWFLPIGIFLLGTTFAYFMLAVNEVIKNKTEFCGKIYTKRYEEINSAIFDCYSWSHAGFGFIIYGTLSLIFQSFPIMAPVSGIFALFIAIISSAAWEFFENSVLLHIHVFNKNLKHLKRVDSIQNAIADSILMSAGAVAGFILGMIINLSFTFSIGVLLLIIFLADYLRVIR
ncbi:MAG: DUF2585 family protein [Promethearchaeia archaeon]